MSEPCLTAVEVCHDVCQGFGRLEAIWIGYGGTMPQFLPHGTVGDTLRGGEASTRRGLGHPFWEATQRLIYVHACSLCTRNRKSSSFPIVVMADSGSLLIFEKMI